MTEPRIYTDRTPRTPVAGIEKVAVVNPRHPAFCGPVYRATPRVSKATSRSGCHIMSPEMVASQIQNPRRFCRGRYHVCSQLDDFTCWHYDQALPLKNRKPVRCAECVDKKGKL